MNWIWNDHKGLSIIELIVTISIVTVVGLAIISFVSTSTNHYKRESAQASLSNEAQILLGQLETMILNAGNGVRYQVDGTKNQLFLYSMETNGSTNRQIVYNISYERKDSQLLYSSYLYGVEADGSTSLTPIEENQLLARYMNGFSVDLSQVESDKLINVTLSMGVEGKTYSTTSVIKLRNDTSKVSSAEVAFSGTGNVALTPTVTSVVVSPSSLYGWSNSQVTGFSASVIGNNFPIQDVRWDFSEETKSRLTSEDTAIDSISGKVTLGRNENCENLTVVATSLASMNLANSDSTKYVAGTATVKNKFITGLNLNSIVSTTSLKAEGVVEVYGKNFEASDSFLEGLKKMKITYQGNEVSDVSIELAPLTNSEGTNIAPTGEKAVYQVAFTTTNETYDGKTLQVTPLYQEDDYQTSPIDLQFVKKEMVDISIVVKKTADSDWTVADQSSIGTIRGEILSIGLKVTYAINQVESTQILIPGTKDWENISWSVYKGTESSTALGTIGSIASKGAVEIDKSPSLFDYKLEYSFELRADFKGKSSSTTIKIPKVSIAIAQMKGSQTKYPVSVNSTNTIDFVISGLNIKDCSVYKVSTSSSFVQNNLFVDSATGGTTAIIKSTSANTATLTYGLKDSSNQVIEGVSVSIILGFAKSNVYQNSTLYFPIQFNSGDFYSYSGSVYTYYLLNGNLVSYHPLSRKAVYNQVTYSYRSGLFTQ